MRLQKRFDELYESNDWSLGLTIGPLMIKRNTGSGPGCFESLRIWATIDGRWVGNYPSVEGMRKDFLEKAKMYSSAASEIDWYDGKKK